MYISICLYIGRWLPQAHWANELWAMSELYPDWTNILSSVIYSCNTAIISIWPWFIDVYSFEHDVISISFWMQCEHLKRINFSNSKRLENLLTLKNKFTRCSMEFEGFRTYNWSDIWSNQQNFRVLSNSPFSEL